MLRLYSAARCPFCARTRMALDEKGVEYELIESDLVDVPEPVRRANPKGLVPVLFDGELAVYESNIINEYLDERFPTPPLMPGDAAGRAEVRMLMDRCEGAMLDCIGVLYGRGLIGRAPSADDDEVVCGSRNEIREIFVGLAERLVDGGFLVGDFGMADISFAPWAVKLSRLGLDEESLPEDVRAWIGRLRERRSIRENWFF